MRWLIAVLAVVALAVAPMGAQAGDYHTGTNLVCSDCHVAHYSVSHGYTPTGFTPSLGAGGPHAFLLRAEGNELCLMCHDNQSWAPDVFGANTGSTVRMAGALNSFDSNLLANDAGYNTIDGHSLWSDQTAPGGTFSKPTGLECIDCHSQHGQNVTQYRNLQFSTSASSRFYNKAVTYAKVTQDGTKDVFEAVDPYAGGVTNLTAYAQGNIEYNEPNTAGSAYGAWCQSCHTEFHGAGGDANMGSQPHLGDANTAFPWLRHPTADVNIGQNASYISSLTQYNSHTNKVKVMNPGAVYPVPATVPAGATPSCFSCHKSHGNQNGFGLIFMAGTGPVTEQGDGGVYKDLCRQCHVQGG